MRIGDKHSATRAGRARTSGDTEDLRRRGLRSSPIRTARSRPATSSSPRATTASPPIARSSTPRQARHVLQRRRHRQQCSRRRQPPAGRDRAAAGAGQETDVYFFGDTVEKIGPKKYRITNGGFTTCVQPTPRWDLTPDTVVLNIDHYTLLSRRCSGSRACRCSTCRPLLPDQREDRATGFLMPTYGSSTLRGQTIHNAFFWAIDRSQDATFMHDWFSKTGQGVGPSTATTSAAAPNGNITRTTLERARGDVSRSRTAACIAAGDAQLTSFAAARTRLLPGRLRARGRVDYFSSIATKQTFKTNIDDAYAQPAHVRRQRRSAPGATTR